MAFWARLRGIWRTLAHRRRMDRELDQELDAALDSYTDRYAAAGLDARAARRAASIAFGGVTQVKESVRDHRTGAGLETLLLDIRHSIRSLRRTPTLTVVIVVTLAIGIGANAAMSAS